MSIRCFFKRQFPRRSRTRGVAFLLGVLLICGCGGEESVDKPMVETVGDEKRNEAVPISTTYYPTAVGNRLSYRDADGVLVTVETEPRVQFRSSLLVPDAVAFKIQEVPPFQNRLPSMSREAVISGKWQVASGQ